MTPSHQRQQPVNASRCTPLIISSGNAVALLCCVYPKCSGLACSLETSCPLCWAGRVMTMEMRPWPVQPSGLTICTASIYGINNGPSTSRLRQM